MPWHVVQQGECLSSIAHDAGLLWQTVWNHPDNASLKQKRKNPNVLLPGDRLFLPDKQLQEFDRPTDARHKFKRKNTPAKLRLRCLDPAHHPHRNCPYTLTIDGQTFTGHTDSNGLLSQNIPPNAASATLDLQLPDKTLRYLLRLGHLNPHDDLTGLQHRLRNLGYYIPDDSGTLDTPTSNALKFFQQKYKLNVTGQPDEPTLNKLKEIHGQ
ncbi:MAG: peptidoglycan-binding protein [Phycisphaerae bacterium]